jgi:hypothetical protein
MKACMCVIYVPIGEKRFVCKRTEEEKKITLTLFIVMKDINIFMQLFYIEEI